MAQNIKRLGPLYRKIGLDTNSELITKRIEAAENALGELDAAKIATLAFAALGLTVGQGEIGWFIEIFQANDPTFAPSGGDRETALLAGAVLWAEMESTGDRPLVAALALSTASFGELRRAEAGAELIAYANERLREAQKHRSEPIASATYVKKPDLSQLVAQLQQAGNQNTLQGGWTPIRDLLTMVNNYAEKAQLHIVEQLNAVIAHQKQLEEEMRLHWWVVGGWSQDRMRPFAKLDPGEAAFRAGKEFADLTTLPAGPYAAPALLDMVLQKGRRSLPDSIKLADAVIQTPGDWRTSWASKLAASANAALYPVSLAAALAADSGDAPDWKPRFARTAAVAADTEISPLDLSLQVLKERLLWRMLDQERE